MGQVSGEGEGTENAVLVSDLWGQSWEAAGLKELVGWIDGWTWGSEISDGLRVETVWDCTQIPRSHLNLPLNEFQESFRELKLSVIQSLGVKKVRGADGVRVRVVSRQ